MSVKTSNIPAALKKPFMNQTGTGNPASVNAPWDNGYTQTALKASGTATQDLIGLGSDDSLFIGGAPALMPCLKPIIFRAVANAGVATRHFHAFTSVARGRIVAIDEFHGTKGTHASAVTATITKDKAGQAAGAGTSLMSGSFNMKGDDNTLQSATLSSNKNDLTFVPGERLSFKLTGTNTSLANVMVVVWVQYETNIFETSVYLASAAATVFFLANRKYPIQAVAYAHGTAEATTTGLNCELKIQDGTETEAQGTDILTNNSNAGFDCLAAANVVQNGTFTALSMIAGERLSLTIDDTATELANVVMTVAFTAQPNRIEVSHWDPAPAATDHNIFIANRNFRLLDGRQIHGTAAGGASTMQLEKVTGTTAAGSGTNLLGTAWDLNATADTVQIAAFITTAAVATLQLDSGDRLAHDFANAIQSTTNFAATYSLLGE